MQTATKPEGKTRERRGGFDWNINTWALVKSVPSLPIRLGIRCTNGQRRCQDAEGCGLRGVENRKGRATDVANSLGVGLS